MTEESQSARDRRNIDKITADYLASAGNRLSGLDLEEIGMDGHDLANRVWRVVEYLRTRNVKPGD